MEYRRLGKSGLQVSALSFGSWVTFGSQIEDNTSEELMKYAYDQGVNFFDNADNTSKTISNDGNYVFPIRAVRVKYNSGTGSVVFNLRQSIT